MPASLPSTTTGTARPTPMNHNRKASVAVIAALAGVAVCGPAVAESTFDPYFGLDLMWLDNLNLAGPGQAKQEEYIAQAAPGLRFTEKTRRLEAYLDYRLQALFYKDESD